MLTKMNLEIQMKFPFILSGNLFLITYTQAFLKIFRATSLFLYTIRFKFHIKNNNNIICKNKAFILVRRCHVGTWFGAICLCQFLENIISKSSFI